MSMEIVAANLCFPEGPRWHDGRLWFSDMHAHRVLALNADGTLEAIVEVPNWPSGLGWLPDGDLLVVSMTDRLLLRWDGQGLTTHADLSELASYHCNDMVVDQQGRAYVGNFGFDLHAGGQQKAAELVLVDADGSARIVADDLRFPNGTVIAPDGKSLIVAETMGARLSAFDIEADGSLRNRQVWAAMPRGVVPDGICLDEAGGIWVASPTTNECLRVEKGGNISHRIATDQGAYACMLGADLLYVLTSSSSDPDACQQQPTGRIEAVKAPYPRAGWP